LIHFYKRVNNMTLNMASTTAGPPKIRKNASKSKKKSWKKNIDMTEVDSFLEEQRLEERTGGVLADKKTEDIFVLDTSGQDAKEKRRKKKEKKPLRCHAMLEGLPGVPDPKPIRPRVRTVEERMNPVVKKKLALLKEQGLVTAKDKDRARNRAVYQQMKKQVTEDKKTRRRTKFDFDLWGADATEEKPQKKETGVDDQWINHVTKVHTKVWTNDHIPKAAKTRSQDSTGSLLPAVEVPHPGTSYNPALKDHQDLLLEATLIQMEKEKEEKRVERATTGMFPNKADAPTEKSYLQEMSEGIAELGGKVDEEEEEEKTEDPASDEESKTKSKKPKTRKQKRDAKKRGHEDRKKLSLLRNKRKEIEIFKLKSMKKEMKVLDAATEENQKRKEEKKIEKLKNPIQLSRYKYQPQELELKLSDELTGNLRNLKPEGSILEDRYKSLQRRNIIETRVVQKMNRHKVKRVDKRDHKMGWEEAAHRSKNAKKNRRKSRQKKA